MSYSKEELQDIPSILKKPGGQMMDRLSNEVLTSDIDYLPELTRIAFSNKTPINWRACWVIDRMGRTDAQRMLPWVKDHEEQIINVTLPKQSASFMNMLARMKVADEELVPYFDYACKWVTIAGSDNTNYYALKLMVRIAKHIPELMQEVKLYAEEVHTRSEKPYLKKYSNQVLNLK
jgi:hypothetical protein